MTSQIEKLAECPFSDTDKEIGHNPWVDNNDGLPKVCCTCGASGPMMATADGAIEAWNRHQSPDMVSVPREPTEAMTRAGYSNYVDDPVDYLSAASEVYKAMIAAAEEGE